MSSSKIELIYKSTLCSDLGKLDRDAEALGNSLTILRVDLVEELDHLLLDVSPSTAERTADVLNEVSSVSLVHDLSEESSGLLEIIIRVLVRVSASESGHSELTLLLAGVLNGAIMRVRLIVRSTAAVAVDSSGAISLIGGNSSSVRAVNGDLVVVGTESVSVGIGVREESSLEHFISRGRNARNNVGWGKSRLLYLSKVVLGVLVEDDFADGDKRVVLVRDNLCNIKDVILVLLTLLLGNELNIPGPRREVALLDVLEEVLSGIILASCRKLTSLFGGKVLNPLVGLEVILDIVNLTLVINPLVGVRTVAVHVSVSIGGTAVREKNGDLVERVWGVGPEVPSHVWVTQVGLGVSLLAVNKVRELDRVLNEEHWGVVADHVIISFLCVELNGKASGVSNSVS